LSPDCIVDAVDEIRVTGKYIKLLQDFIFWGQKGRMG